jgi:murein hydrolase activator
LAGKAAVISLLSAASASSAHAQETAPAVAAPRAEVADPTQSLDAKRAETAEELDRLSRAITLSEQRMADLRAEVDALRQDEAAIRESMIETADRQRELTTRMAEAEDRFSTLRGDEDEITASLRERRVLLAEVLAGLQRMGRNPPPALLVAAEDALASVRSAILLGAVVPEMREETEQLAQDLARLKSVREDIEEERAKLVAARTDQVVEEERLALLLAEKREMQGDRERRIEEERVAAARLAERASSLGELIASLETEISSVREAAEQAREATRLREQQSEEELERARNRAASGDLDMERFSPAVPFASRTATLELPVEGAVERWYGDDDGTGHPLQGIMVASRSGALVQAPADAWVVYAGPFRTYGQLLILNAGDEYHIVMAGMDRIDVSPGQFVVTGEPVAAMGETRLAGAAALALVSGQPTLYIEFRKDGQPVDPDPWWANDTSGRASNDS